MFTYQPRGVVQALIATLLRTSLKLLLKPVFSPRWSIAFQRRWLGWIARVTLLAPNVYTEAAQAGGVAGEWLRRRHAPAVRPGAVLYLHGGAYCVGSPATHRSLTSRLCWHTGLPVFALDYRLAPEHPYPAALDDALAAYRALRAQGPVILAGDSAGGGLALATALALRDAGAPPPAALVLLSPWVDLNPTALPPNEPAGETMLSHAWMNACAAHYLGAHAQGGAAATLSAPGISPIKADLRGLPPTLIQAGTDELLRVQALQLHAALRAADVTSRCEITQDRWHVAQMHGGALRSADESLARIAQFVLPVLDAAAPSTTQHQVVILGGGMSGLCMAIRLQRAGMHDFVIVEKQPGLGGTWWDNSYPGAHVDVPSPVYSFSFAPNPRWSRRFASASEIQSYMQGLAERHGLLAHMRLGSRLTTADFDEASGQWRFATERGDQLQSRFFVCSTGPLNQLRWPDIPGLERFQGARLHSARWDHHQAMDGQRVAVIGTGSTASQLIPPIAEQAGAVHVFQRTANWVLPRLDRRYNGLDHLLAHLPPYAALVRWSWMQALEWGRRGFNEGTAARRGMLKMAQLHLNRQVGDTTLRKRLTPNYPLGCKRIIYSNDFYRAMAEPHVELVTDAIERITEHGVVTSDGREREVDMLVCATGFDTINLLSSIQVTGLHGHSLRQTWGQGPQAFHGLSVAGFPNLFLMLGPNTATGHTSTLLFIEPAVDHAIACMQAVLQGGHRCIEVRAEVMQAHNQQLQSRLVGSVWSQCRSWYRAPDGRVVALFPGFTKEYVQAVRRPDFADYRFG